jgi:hypothetical protein
VSLLPFLRLCREVRFDLDAKRVGQPPENETRRERSSAGKQQADVVFLLGDAGNPGTMNPCRVKVPGPVRRLCQIQIIEAFAMPQ